MVYGTCAVVSGPVFLALAFGALLADERGRDLLVLEDPRVPATSFAGTDPNREPSVAGCTPATTALQFDGGYEVAMCYRTPDGEVGQARAGIWASGQAGLLWFFDRGNAEVLVKVLDGCSHNGHRWVFVAPVTTLEFNLRVTAPSGQRWSHSNAQGETASAKSDTTAFRCEDEVAVGDASSGGARRLASDLQPSAAAGCTPATTALEFDGGYTVSMCYRTPGGEMGQAKSGIWSSGQAGLLWFFDRGNAEVLVKVLDGCSHNGHRWVFVAPVTTLEFDLWVTGPTGRRWTHGNSGGATATTRSDTGFFPCADEDTGDDDTGDDDTGDDDQGFGDDLDALLDGVTKVGIRGYPGPLCVYGPEAFPVIVSAVRDVRAPAVAAGPWAAGRVVVLGHDEYISRLGLETMDNGRLMTNALRWAGRKSRPTVGIVDAGDLRPWLRRAGYDAVEVAFTPESLRTVDVVALGTRTWNRSAAELEALSAFVRGGGGLVTATTAWAWRQLFPDLDFPGNPLLAAAGIQWDDYAPLARESRAGNIADPGYLLTHAGKAVEAIEAYIAGNRALTQSEVDLALYSVERALVCAPGDDALFRPRVQALLDRSDWRWPSVERPVRRADLASRLAAALSAAVHRHTPPEQLRAHPTAGDFPGPVPANAPRVVRRFAIDTAVPRRHSTGLYAAPGELAHVQLPAGAATDGRFSVLVGAHTDDISGLPEWRRMPVVSRSFPVVATTTPVANAFGGLIYVEVPEDAGLGRITVEISGAVAAPLFVLGETDPVAWRNEIRHAPAPWAEIAGRNMIVTTRSSEVRDLDDAAAVAEVWDRVLDLSAELAAWAPSARRYPERFVVDEQISVGYMHAGYPLMAHLDQSAHLVDAMHIRTCRYDWTQSNWGFFHEVGHNHQNYDWTFDGTVEVTVNLFTLYVYEFLCGIPVAENWRGSAAFQAEQMALYDFDDPDFELWKREPFLALVMYQQMQQAFGWDAYRQVFATYRDLPDDERPKSDDEKRDQWLVRFSRQVGRNLGPFFENWGVPTSQEARDSIADLPTWMPPDFPP